MHEENAGGGQRTSQLAPHADTPATSRRRWWQSSFSLDSTASSLGWGALAALGRPGIDVPLLFVASVGGLMVSVVTAPSTRVACVRALLFGVAVATPIAIGAQSWGWLVPLGMTVVCVGGYFLPLALLVRWSASKASSSYAALFLGVAWSLYSWFLGALDVPLACISQSLVPSVPWLFGGARLLGTSIVEGALTATLFAMAVALARSRGEAARLRIQTAVRPLAVGLGGVLLLAGFARVAAPASDGQVKVGIVQVNAGAEYHGARLAIPMMQQLFDRQLEGLLAQLTDVELVVMPETFDGRYTLMLPALRDAWSARAQRQHQAYLLTSYLSDGNGRKSNAAGLIDASGTLTGVHRKVVLAPYGERGLAAGNGYRALPLRDGDAVGVAICQETMSDFATQSLTEAGATLLVGTSSDISFGSSLVPFEHLAATRLRAIEAGRSLVWASNAGPSGVVDRWGSSAALSPFRRAVALKTWVELHRETTPFHRLRRQWWGLLVVAVAAIGWLMRREALRPRELVRVAPSSRWQAVAPATLLAIVLATLPALVELRHGSSPRALAAITDLWTSEAVLPLRRNMERFYTTPEQSYAGALALFLSYYGQELAPDAVPAPKRGGLGGLQDLLRERYQLETRLVRLGEVLPETAAIVALSDGRFGVLAAPTGQSSWLLWPGQRALGPISSEQRTELGGRDALLPALMTNP